MTPSPLHCPQHGDITSDWARARQSCPMCNEPVGHGAFYNENNPKAAAWLRNLVEAGEIPAGVVDERSICDITADDLRGFTQIHLFCGIGGWPLALRLAGWPDDRAIITGSCPCPPFSCAGKKKPCPECQCREVIPHPRKTGIFACVACAHEWFADGRHLWPEMLRIIGSLAGPLADAPIFGEQVAGGDGLIWLAGVRATLEELGRAVGAADLCAASVGSPHIRQRLYWVANAGRERCTGIDPLLRVGTARGRPAEDLPETAGNGEAHRLADSNNARPQIGRTCEHRENGFRLANDNRLETPEHGGISRLGNSILPRLEGHAGHGDTSRGSNAAGSTPETGAWGDFYIVHCRDDKYRRIGSDAAPLAHGVPRDVGPLLAGLGGVSADTKRIVKAARRNRLTRIEGYGNAIVPALAAEFIRACMDTIAELTPPIPRLLQWLETGEYAGGETREEAQ